MTHEEEPGWVDRLAAPPVNHGLPPLVSQQLAAQVAPGWRAHASCAGADPDAWFPENGQEPLPAVTSTCLRCPVNRSCLAVALLWREDGIWATTNPVDRRAATRSLRRGVPVPVVLDELLTRPRQDEGRRTLEPFSQGDAA